MTSKKSSVKYLWEKKTGTELQFWPKTSAEHYLTRPTLPKNLVLRGRHSRISAPEELSFDVLETRGVLNAAITEHNGNYYQSRADEDFSIVVYTIEGGAYVRFDKREFKIGRSSVFVSPAGSSYEFRANSHWKNIWFHLKGTDWNSLLGTLPIIKKAKFWHRIKDASFDYFDEVYKRDRSLRLLEIYADLIAYFLREEFRADIDRISADLDAAFIAIRENMALPTEEIVKTQSVASVGKSMRKRYGISLHEAVSRIKMREARELLQDGGFTLSQIACRIGYANAYAFSKAFKIRNGMSPVEYMKL